MHYRAWEVVFRSASIRRVAPAWVRRIMLPPPLLLQVVFLVHATIDCTAQRRRLADSYNLDLEELRSRFGPTTSHTVWHTDDWNPLRLGQPGVKGLQSTPISVYEPILEQYP